MLPAQGSAFGLLVLFVVDQRNAPSDGARSALVLGLIMAVNVSALVIRFRGATVMLEIELHTPRLRLRGWRTEDLRGFAALNADPEVMRHFPSVMSRAQSDAMARRIQAHFALHGFGQWVLERREQPGLIGALGLQQVNFEAAFTPAVEIGWRLQRAHWRQGYAREAAEAVLAYAFESLQLNEVLAFTVPANRPSQGLMQRLGMQHQAAQDFEHPLLPVGHPLRQHVLYRLSQASWRTRQARALPAS